MEEISPSKLADLQKNEPKKNHMKLSKTAVQARLLAEKIKKIF